MKKIIIILLIITIILGVFVWGYSSSGAENIKDYGNQLWTSTKETVTGLFTPKSKPADETEPADGKTDQEVLAIEQGITVDLNDVTRDLFKDIPRTLSLESLSPCDMERLYQDAVCLKMEIEKYRNSDGSYSIDDYTELVWRIVREILQNPIFCDMVIRGTVDLRLSTGTTDGELNPWKYEFIALTDSAYEAGIGAAYWCEYNQEGDIDVTEFFRSFSEPTAVWFLRLTPIGIRNWMTTENWRLNTSNDNMNMRRTEIAPYQEDLDALVFAYQYKGQEPEFYIGFNLTDKRLEKYGNNPTPPDSPTGPPPGPTPTPHPKKDPAEDPVNQGNANIGGGSNQPSDGAGIVQPTIPPWQPTGPLVTPTPTPIPIAPPSGGNYQHIDNGTPPATPPLPVPTDTIISDGHGGSTPINHDPVNNGVIPETD